MQTYYVAKMLLILHKPRSRTTASQNDILLRNVYSFQITNLYSVPNEVSQADVQNYANIVIDIALSGLSDGALVHATQALLPGMLVSIAKFSRS